MEGPRFLVLGMSVLTVVIKLATIFVRLVFLSFYMMYNNWIVLCIKV